MKLTPNHPLPQCIAGSLLSSNCRRFFPFLAMVIYLLFLTLPSSGQKIHSLQQSLKKMPKDSTYCKTLYQLAEAYWIAGNDSLTRVYCLKTIELSQKIGYYRAEGEARLLLVRRELETLSDVDGIRANLKTVDSLWKKHGDKKLEAWARYRRAQFSTIDYNEQKYALALFERAEKLAREIGDKSLQGKVLGDLGYRKNLEGKLAEAIDFFLQAKRIQEVIPDSFSLQGSTLNIAVAYQTLGRNDMALRYLNEADAIATKLNDPKIKALVLANKGDIYYSQHNYTKALEVFFKSAKINEKTKTVGWLPNTYAGIANCYLSLKDYPKALTYANKSKNLYLELAGPGNMQLMSQAVLGNIYLAQHDYNRVIPLAKEGLQFSVDHEPVLLREAADFRLQLSKAYEGLNQPQQALKYLQAHKADTDSLYSKEKVQNALLSSMEYDYEKKQQGNVEKIKMLENEKLRFTRNALIGISVVGLLILLYVIWVNRRLQKQNQEISSKYREIEAAQLKGQNQERKRVASELHDNLSTKLVAIRWRLEALQPHFEIEKHQSIYASSIESLNQVYADVRMISHNLLPEELEKNGLVPTLSNLLEELNAMGRIQFRMFVSGTFDALSSKISYELYHLLLELLNNILKHSLAANAELRLTGLEDFIEIVVSDDGVGIQSNDKNNGMGLANVRERVSALNGSVNFDNDQGLKVNVKIPLEPLLQ